MKAPEVFAAEAPNSSSANNIIPDFVYKLNPNVTEKLILFYSKIVVE